MGWRQEDFDKWAASPITLALRENVKEAVEMLQNKLVYEEKEATIYRLQGACQAYKDFLNNLTTGIDLAKGEQEDESSN